MTGAAATAGWEWPRAAGWLAAAALAVLAAIAADAFRSQREVAAVASPLDPADVRPGAGPRTFAEALDVAELAVERTRHRLARRPADWLHMEGLADALAARHRLTGNPEDLAEADRLLDRAIGIAPWPAGPALSRAAVSLLLHDLDGAEAALARFDAWAVPGSPLEQAAARSMRCEIAFQRGLLAEARGLCGEGRDAGLALRRANMAAKTGDAAEAARIVESLLRAERWPPAELARLSLHRASIALAVGDWQTSGRWVRAAEAVFPGYWLSEAFVAQQFALEGEREEARRRYAALAERTGDPDVMDALALLATADGRSDQAREWAARAGEAWRARQRLLPLTYATHHAEHLTLYGDRREAQALAEADFRRRPFPATIGHYAFALWRGGDPERALEVVREGQARGFLTADLKLAEAVSLGALGKAAEAGQALAEARRLNPRVDHARQQFVRFGRD